MKQVFRDKRGHGPCCDGRCDQCIFDGVTCNIPRKVDWFMLAQPMGSPNHLGFEVFGHHGRREQDVIRLGEGDACRCCLDGEQHDATRIIVRILKLIDTTRSRCRRHTAVNRCVFDVVVLKRFGVRVQDRPGIEKHKNLVRGIRLQDVHNIVHDASCFGRYIYFWGFLGVLDFLAFFLVVWGGGEKDGAWIDPRATQGTYGVAHHGVPDTFFAEPMVTHRPCGVVEWTHTYRTLVILWDFVIRDGGFRVEPGIPGGFGVLDWRCLSACGGHAL